MFRTAFPQRLAFSSSLVVLALVLILPDQAAAGRCVDVEVTTDAGARRYLITNTCRDPLEVTLRSRKGRVCAELRVEPGVTRAFLQREVCEALSELTAGCRCESQVLVEERRTR